MTRICARVLLGLVLLATTASNVAAQTQPATETVIAPIPPALLNAKRVFIANGAGDNDADITKFTNGADGLYNQFHANVKALGRYDLVTSPSDADVVLELRVDYAVFNRGFIYPKFRVEVRDPKTNVLLWSFTEPVNGAFLTRTGRKNVGQALARLTDDLKKATTP